MFRRSRRSGCHLSDRQGATVIRTLLSGPAVLLRLEGLAVFALATSLYAATGGNWVIYLLLFLAPDVSMLGYLAGPRGGAVIYNLVHTYTNPAAIAAYAYFARFHPALALALILFAHIGIDRLLGFGLKYPSGFKD